MINSFFVSDAFAQASEVASSAAAPDFSLSSFVPLVLIFAVFYFFIIRPQNKKMRDHQQMVNNLKSGNKVITTAGIIGVVRSVDQKENQLELEISAGVLVKILKNYVSEVVVEQDKKTKK